MNLVIYEHPLNEKLRTFMRIEHLFMQLNHCKNFQSDYQYRPFFDSLFALMELFERNDIRVELGKELERNEHSLVKWAAHPQICNDTLQQTLKKVMQLQSTLSKMPRICSGLKEDPFLGNIRQRFAIPGGNCHFDLPQLHFWLHLPEQQQNARIDSWLKQLTTIEEAIGLILSFVRERNPFTSIKAPGGFYQDNAENIELLRIQYTPAYGAYPTVSGNKYRYAIRFMQLTDEQEQGRESAQQDVIFSLACC